MTLVYASLPPPLLHSYLPTKCLLSRQLCIPTTLARVALFHYTTTCCQTRFPAWDVPKTADETISGLPGPVLPWSHQTLRGISRVCSKQMQGLVAKGFKRRLFIRPSTDQVTAGGFFFFFCVPQLYLQGSPSWLRFLRM